MSEKLHCPKCGHEIERENPVCPGCGAKLKVRQLKIPEKHIIKVPKSEADADGGRAEGGNASGAKFCTQCGRRLEAGERFCTGCGAAVEGDAPGRARVERRTSQGSRMNESLLDRRDNSPVNARTVMVSVAVICASVCGILWIGGCIDAATSVEEGMNYFRYRAKVDSMNVISRSGFNYYMDNFTNAREQRKKVDEGMERLRELFE